MIVVIYRHCVHWHDVGVASLTASFPQMSVSSSAACFSSCASSSESKSSFISAGYSRTKLTRLPPRKNFVCRNYAVETAFQHISRVFGCLEARPGICTILGCPGSGKTEFFAQIMQASYSNTLSSLGVQIQFPAEETICLAVTLNCDTPLVTAKEAEYSLVELVMLRLYFIWFTDGTSFSKMIRKEDIASILKLSLKQLLQDIRDKSGKKRCILLIDEPIKLLQLTCNKADFIDGITDLVGEQNGQLAIIFSSLLLLPFLQEASNSNREIIKIPMNLLDLPDVSEKLLPELAPELPNMIKLQCAQAGGGDAYTALASITGGFPRLIEFAATSLKERDMSASQLLDTIINRYIATENIDSSLDLLDFALVSLFFRGRYSGNNSVAVDSLVKAGLLSRQCANPYTHYLVIPQFVLMLYSRYVSELQTERECQLKRALQFMFDAEALSGMGKPWEFLCLSIDRIKRAVRDDSHTGSGVTLLGLYQPVYVTTHFPGHTMCPEITGQLFDLSNLLTAVRRYSDDTDFSKLSIMELTSSVWYPASDTNAGFDYAVFYQPVTGASTINDLVVVVTECKFSKEDATTVLQWSTVIEKHKNAIVKAKRLFGINEEKVVFRVAPWRRLPEPQVGTAQSLPKNIIVHSKDGLCEFMAPTMTLVVQNLGVLTT
jgi:hypothetical protein